MKMVKTIGILAAVVLVMGAATFYADQLAGKKDKVFATDSIVPVVQTQTSQQHEITVSGEGELTVAPDVAYVSVGLETEAATAKDAQAQNAQQFEQIKQVIKQYNLKDQDVQTSNFSVQPQYKYEQQKAPQITGYQAVHTLQITYHDLPNLGVFLDALSQAGANHINGITFSTDQTQQYEIEAIKKAMDNAQAKAKAIADFAGKPLKELVTVTQDSSSVPVRYTSYDSMKLASSAAPSTSISSGELKVTASIHATFSF